MRKILSAVCILLAVVSACGCSSDNSGGITERSEVYGAGYEADEPDFTSAPDNSPAATEYSGEETSEAVPAAAIPATALTHEAAPAVDPVALAESFSSEYLGLPAVDTVYIFRDKGETAEINGAVCYGVSCYDDSSGQLSFICDFYISGDGTTAYRWYPEEGQYRLLPEDQELWGFDPEKQPPEEIFSQADELYSAVYGDLPYSANEVIETDGGRYHAVTDERLDTAEKLNSALKRFFAGEALEQLLQGSDSVIADENGRLYCLEHSGGNVGYLGTEYTLESLTDEKAVFSAVSRYEYEAGNISEKRFSCIAEKTDGGWRFTKFQMP